jgi:hypothetical protein
MGATNGMVSGETERLLGAARLPDGETQRWLDAASVFSASVSASRDAWDAARSAAFKIFLPGDPESS